MSNEHSDKTSSYLILSKICDIIVIVARKTKNKNFGGSVLKIRVVEF